jgi:uroporphyrinogen decarboxylase
MPDNSNARPSWNDSLVMKAARCEPVSRTPVWLMRQAGRYMSEYREVRSQTTFLDLCKSPALCAEVMCTAVDRLGVDAAIIFSDILPILEPMGFDLEYAQGEGPVIHNPFRTSEDLSRITELEDVAPMEYVFETVRLTREALSDGLPVIGFAGAPFTLASYAIEGGSSRSYMHAKSLMYGQPDAWRELMERLARSVARYLNAQIDAGAQLVQLFDSWIGCLGWDDYEKYALPYVQMIVKEIGTAHPDTPVIYFGTGNPALLPLFKKSGAQVIGIDWRIRLDDAWKTVGHDVAVQGNLDPVLLLSTPEIIRQRVAEVLSQAAGRPGHIFNLGHGVLKETPVDNAIALVEAVKELSAK